VGRNERTAQARYSPIDDLSLMFILGSLTWTAEENDAAASVSLAPYAKKRQVSIARQ
jgi:hypothetical protein